MKITTFAVMCAVIALVLLMCVGVAFSQETQEKKQESEQAEQKQETVEPKEGEAQEPKEGEEGVTEPIPDGQGVQWSEMFKAWSTTHYLHIDFTHPETGEWCAVLVIDNRSQQAQCVK